MSSFTLQLGFNWNRTPTQPTTAMTFALLDSRGSLIEPKTVSGATTGEPCAEWAYNFGFGGHLTWEIFDLTGDSAERLLYSVTIHFDRWDEGGRRWIPGTPFREGVGSPGENRWHPPSNMGVGCSGTKDTPLTGDSSSYPYWTPPDPSFVFESFKGQSRSEKATYRFRASIVVDERTFQMDPEMIVGPGKSGN